MLELATASIDAPPLLPLASTSPVATTAAARRAQQDTALWRASEVGCDFTQVGARGGGIDEKEGGG